MSQDLDPVLVRACMLGEGLQWHAPSGRWWWTDIEARRVWAWTPGESELLELCLPDRVGSFVHCRSGAMLFGLAKAVVRWQPERLDATGRVQVEPELLAPLEPGLPSTRANDGRCDRAGHYVFGTLDEASPRQRIGSFYQFSWRHGLRRLALDGVAIANSICFSLDGRRMFYADTLSRRIMVCDYEAESARVAAPRVFLRKGEDEGWPDGSVIDAKGCLWNAEWGRGQVTRYGPDGRALSRHSVPVRNVSCPALGGPAGDELLVTTARQELGTAELMAMPLSGSLFGTRLEPGLFLPEPMFDDLA